MTTHCFYHSSDLDGHCSGAIIKFFRPGCVMHQFNYGWEFPWDDIKSDDEVYMVDISMPPEDLLRLADMCTFYWIDHHKSAIEDAEKGGAANIKGLRLVGKAGCELTWEYLDINEDVPRAVYLLGRHDVWDLEADKDVEPFQYAMRAQKTYPEENMRLWISLLADGPSCPGMIASLVEQGDGIVKYIREDWRKACNFQAFDLEFEGLKFLAMNRQGNTSMFETAITPEHDGLMAFFWSNKGSWRVTMYGNKKGIDVSDVARKYGGGGHAGAAGFHCKELPFKLACESADA